MQKLSEIYVDDVSITYLPSEEPGGPAIEVKTPFKRTLEVRTTSAWLRFVHYLVDTIALYGLFIVLAVVYVTITGGLPEDDGIIYLLLFTAFVGYYMLMEGLLQTTLGKLFTGSIVVDEYGNKPNFKQVAGRSFSRLVPLEHFSYFGEPCRSWHDSWNDTYVVRKKDLAWMKQRLAEQEGGETTLYNSFVARQQ